jgi:hypothetical protein
MMPRDSTSRENFEEVVKQKFDVIDADVEAFPADLRDIVARKQHLYGEAIRLRLENRELDRLLVARGETDRELIDRLAPLLCW